MVFKENQKISAGSFDLNKWLYGGYETNVISMIAGPPGSGKTNFCILAACSQARKKNKVLFVDTEGGFSVDRVKQIVGENYKDILEYILLAEITNFEEQKKFFESISNKIKKDDIGLIVIDGVAMLYRLELGDAIKLKDSDQIRDINREVAMQMKILAEISRKQKIPIIITNQVYTSFLSDEEREKGVKKEMSLVGGDLFKYWSKCIIELKKDYNNRKKAVLLKHRSLPVKELSFEIRDKGIFKKGWI